MKRIYWLANLMLMLIVSPLANADGFNAPLNHYQWIGSHNSYKRPLPSEALAFLQGHSPKMATALNYAHTPLNEQLNLGLRQLEIDVVNDPTGNQYHRIEMAERFNDHWLTTEEKAQLIAPGFKVMHIPHLDALSHCVTLTACMQSLMVWSDANPDHFPVVILVNAKESQPNFLTYPSPTPFTPLTYEQLDAAFTDLLADKLFTPDMLRGDAKTLKAAVTQNGWPTAEALRGRWIILFDGNEKQRAMYKAEHPSLQGRAMFASYPIDSDEAAIFIKNNPLLQFKEIQQLVSDGYLVRTRADANLRATDEEKQQQRDAAIRSGAQMISTDFYPTSPQTTGKSYRVLFSDGSLRRYSTLF